MIKIGIVDDHQLFLDGLTSILSAQEDFKIIFAVDNAMLALQLIQKQPIDILITDISMPNMNGLELIHLIKQKQSDIKIIVMSSFRDLVNKKHIDAYLLKNTPKEQLIEVIKNLHNKNEKHYYSKKIDNQDINFKKNILSPREKEIVIAISKGYSSSEISNMFYISINTVETHRKNIFYKLNITNTAQLVSIAMKLGIID
ncbi:response regulator transcription factor [Epilithonimonas arachidiradicis]|uniref:DNA-binding response regulator n=1 Tax=Epilithonimonas arachidiradicis TaxID=1617282 RepID=A0A420D9W7_9FLAO|nr:response regulator transcription factor [Epilithonimonas arachidiradicis]RKE87827.1 LuxR family two component transcriptional regulator [Epilithonimonas arachidiradicis]GGG58199.1 DNA-binding response regulator [Epilithonimonas arachidiradicis]